MHRPHVPKAAESQTPASVHICISPVKHKRRIPVPCQQSTFGTFGHMNVIVCSIVQRFHCALAQLLD